MAGIESSHVKRLRIVFPRQALVKTRSCRRRYNTCGRGILLCCGVAQSSFRHPSSVVPRPYQDTAIITKALPRGYVVDWPPPSAAARCLDLNVECRLPRRCQVDVAAVVIALLTARAGFQDTPQWPACHIYPSHPLSTKPPRGILCLRSRLASLTASLKAGGVELCLQLVTRSPYPALNNALSRPKWIESRE